ncbi:hypothetical protein [Yunchengibacter salinarum]|uniref:hypothetical protein n=1 Tax=Yunchengibacter salinarum TaxID=3133399 RepID=UPI0035B685E2
MSLKSGSFGILLASLLAGMAALIASGAVAADPVGPEGDQAPGKAIWLEPHDLAEDAENAPRHMRLSLELFRLLAGEMDDVTFRVSGATPARTRAMLEQRPNVCVGNRLKNAVRARYTVGTTLPQLVAPGLRLFLRRDAVSAMDASRPEATETVRLDALLRAHPGLTLGVPEGRFYGRPLDRLLADPPHPGQVWRVRTPDINDSVVSLLHKGRFDGLLEYENQFRFYSSPAELARILPLKLEESPAFIPGYILCSRTDTGRRLVAAFDRAIRTLSREHIFLAIHLRWWRHVDRAALVQFYNDTYGTAFSLPPGGNTGEPSAW